MTEIETWTDQSLRSFAAMARVQIDEAARLWLRAAEIAEAAPLSAPVLAASRSNAGVARLILDNANDARRAFRKAEEAWRLVISSIATLDIPMTGATSFHFRLATKVPHALIEARRRRYRQLAEAALGITRFNRLLVDDGDPASEIVALHARDLMAILKDILGPCSPEVRLLAAPAEQATDASVFSSYAPKAADFAHRQRTLSATLSEDCAALEAAVTLTALLGPQTFSAVRRLRETKKARSEIGMPH
ncbi:hypothetical protein [Hyphomicrobium sp. ghe19]|uniref:hypothetical protein n=1 Tax=Hyphomicrobium sp. ghe19 TaxID=2682968 RepID=UPI0013670C13|nr:hypothetical protein HYPP_02737 [Hyphomicrobium sp. ghe19]